MRAGMLLLAVALGVAGCGSAPPRSDTDVRGERLAGIDERAQRALAADDPARAARYYREALRIAESIEDFPAIGIYSLNLAAVYHALERGDLARAAIAPLLASPERFGRGIVAEAAGRAALIALEAGELDAAGQWLDRAQHECAAPGCRADVALQNLRGRLLLERGRAAEARAALARTLAAARAEGSQEETANALRTDARAAARMGAYGEAVALLGQALEIDRRLGIPAKIALDLQALAEVELGRGNRAAARDYAARALAVSRAAGRRGAQEAARRFLEANP